MITLEVQTYMPLKKVGNHYQMIEPVVDGSIRKEVRHKLAIRLMEERKNTRKLILSGYVVRVWPSGIVKYTVLDKYEDGRCIIGIDRVRGLLWLERDKPKG